MAGVPLGALGLGLLGPRRGLPLAVSLACFAGVLLPLTLAQRWVSARPFYRLRLVLLVMAVLALALVLVGAQYHYLSALLQSRRIGDALAGSLEWARGRSGGNLVVLVGPWLYLNVVVTAALVGVEEDSPWGATRSTLASFVGWMAVAIAGLIALSELGGGRSLFDQLASAVWAGVCIALTFGLAAYPTTFLLLFVLLVADGVERWLWPPRPRAAAGGEPAPADPRGLERDE